MPTREKGEKKTMGRPKGSGGIPVYGLRALRLRKGWTIDMAVEHTGVSRSTIMDLEKGRRGASGETLRSLSAGYGVDPEELTAP